jgi:hypothetical protein
MEAPVIAAIITSFVALVGPIITYYVTKRIENRANRSVPRPGLDIRGHWQGTGQDLSAKGSRQNPRYTYEILRLTIEGDVNRMTLSSTYRLQGENEPERVTNGDVVIIGEYAQCRYTVTVPGRHGSGFGVMLLRFHPSGSRADGYFIARSMKDDGVIYGTVDLHR